MKIMNSFKGVKLFIPGQLYQLLEHLPQEIISIFSAPVGATVVFINIMIFINLDNFNI